MKIKRRGRRLTEWQEKSVSGSDNSSFYRPLENSAMTKDLFTAVERNKGGAASSLRQRLVLVIVVSPLFPQHLGQRGSWCETKHPDAKQIASDDRG